MIELKFHFDASHGWLKVPKKVVKFLGIKPSQYSYEDQSFIYLEEDCDAPKFEKIAKLGSFPIKVIHVDDGDSSPIRNKARVK